MATAIVRFTESARNLLKEKKTTPAVKDKAKEIATERGLKSITSELVEEAITALGDAAFEKPEPKKRGGRKAGSGGGGTVVRDGKTPRRWLIARLKAGLKKVDEHGAAIGDKIANTEDYTEIKNAAIDIMGEPAYDAYLEAFMNHEIWPGSGRGKKTEEAPAPAEA